MSTLPLDTRVRHAEGRCLYAGQPPLFPDEAAEPPAEQEGWFISDPLFCGGYLIGLGCGVIVTLAWVALL